MLMPKPKPKTYVIASPLEGILLKEGEPLRNTKIIRTLKWNGNEDGYITEHYTDDKGAFSLPMHEEELALGILNQFVANMALDVEVKGEIYELWYNNKFSPGIYAESEGEIKGLVCDIKAKEIAFNIGASKIMTRCRWDGVPSDFVMTGL